jgi:hypothetical protein
VLHCSSNHDSTPFVLPGGELLASVVDEGGEILSTIQWQYLHGQLRGGLRAKPETFLVSE